MLMIKVYFGTSAFDFLLISTLLQLSGLLQEKMALSLHTSTVYDVLI